MGPQGMSGGPVNRKQLGVAPRLGSLGRAQPRSSKKGQGVVRLVLPEYVGSAPQVVTPGKSCSQGPPAASNWGPGAGAHHHSPPPQVQTRSSDEPMTCGCLQ